MKKTIEELEDICKLQDKKMKIIKNQIKLVLEYCNKDIYEFKDGNNKTARRNCKRE
jgi:hypothetical protein